MSNPLPLDRLLRVPMVDPKTGMLTRDWARYLGFNEQRVGPALSPGVMQPSGSTNVQKVVGQIQATAKIQNRTEPISTTVGNIDSAGNLQSLSNVNTRTTDLLVDGTGFPLRGGKKADNAFDVNNRLAGTFRNNPVNVAGTPTSSTGMSNDGVSPAITVAAQTFQFGDGTISYSAGSFDPGSFGTFYAWIVDPTFSGGVPSISFSTTPPNQTSANGIIPLGKITTVGGSAKTGGGYSGGTTSGGAGGRGFVQ